MTRLSISEVSELTGFSHHTLRYYEKIGLIEPVSRNSGGSRSYDEADLAWFDILKRMKATGMNIQTMLRYAKLRQEGESTVSERRRLLESHYQSVKEQIKQLEDNLQYIAQKIEIYQKLEANNGEK